MPSSFYNTIKAQGQVLLDFENQALKQNARILEFMKQHPHKAFTPFEVMEAMRRIGRDYPVTSIRRALTDMTDQGLLQKSKMKEERYGKPNHTWKLLTNL